MLAILEEEIYRGVLTRLAGHIPAIRKASVAIGAIDRHSSSLQPLQSQHTDGQDLSSHLNSSLPDTGRSSSRGRPVPCRDIRAE